MNLIQSLTQLRDRLQHLAENAALQGDSGLCSESAHAACRAAHLAYTRAVEGIDDIVNPQYSPTCSHGSDLPLG